MLGMVQAGLRPREPRVKVMVPCRLAIDGRWSDACIHNVSSRGLLLAGDLPTRRGDYVDIRRGTLVVIGRVMWSKGRFCGIRTQDRISVDALVNEPRRQTAPTPGERRATTRLAAEGRAAHRAERSREIASLLQYVFLIVVGLGGAATVALHLREALSRPMAAVGAALGTPDEATVAAAP